jgi:hypothetical protein
MDTNSEKFTELNIELFDRVDKMISDNDYKAQSETIYQMFEEIDNVLDNDVEDIFYISTNASVIASLVCTNDDDLVLINYIPSDDCNVVVVSEDLTDLAMQGMINEAMEYVENELLKREKYELLNEMKKYEKNS